jgi:hypothetical protein
VAARLVQLLSSFVEATAAYALARLEFAMRHPRIPAPPVVSRLAAPGWEADDLSPEAVRAAWEDVERQLEVARRYLAALDDRRGKRAAFDANYSRLRRSVRELDHYARAVRWLITVEDRDAE